MNQADEQKSRRYRAVRRVALVGGVVNVILALSKIGFGVVGQSQSLVADGVHSVSDLLTDVLVYFVAHHAKEGPDAEHPYGHDRFETAATLGLGIVLILVALGIILDAADRLFHPEQLMRPGAIALYVALFSIIAKELLYRYTLRVARRVNSSMLRANAWHHRSDAISSIVVLVGVAGTLAGLPYLDAIAAVGVGLMIVHIGWQLGWGAMQELVDVGLSEERIQEINRIISSVGGVRSVHMLRTRKMGGHAVADVHVQVEPWLSVSEGHMISDSVASKLKTEIDEINDVTVHIDPEDDERSAPCRGLPLRAETLKLLDESWRDIPCYADRKRIILHYLDGRIHVELFFPASCFKSPEQTRELAEMLRARLKEHAIFGRLQLFFG